MTNLRKPQSIEHTMLSVARLYKRLDALFVFCLLLFVGMIYLLVADAIR